VKLAFGFGCLGVRDFGTRGGCLLKAGGLVGGPVSFADHRDKRRRKVVTKKLLREVILIPP
jgi:hypothetical protein